MMTFIVRNNSYRLNYSALPCGDVIDKRLAVLSCLRRFEDLTVFEAIRGTIPLLFKWLAYAESEGDSVDSQFSEVFMTRRTQGAS